MKLSQGQVDVVRALVREHAGIALAASKAYLVESRLQPVAKAAGFETLSAFIQALGARPKREWTDLIVDAMTTNETFFFRDQHPFTTLQERVLPQLIARRRPQKTLRIWSAGCSTGQEAYSIAMLLDAHFPELSSWSVVLQGSDISRQAVARAQRGVYTDQEVGRGLSAFYRDRYLEPHPEGHQLVRRIRDRVRFHVENIVAGLGGTTVYDVIFMRNMIVYFDADTRLRVFKRIERQLAKDGALFLGAGESPGLDRAGLSLRHSPDRSHFQHDEQAQSVKQPNPTGSG